MTEAEVEKVVLDVVRQYTQNDSAAASSRFESDLHQGELARQRLFALLAQSFTARGVSLPAHGFMLSDFLACPTPAAVRDAIRSKVFGAGEPVAKQPKADAPASGAKAPVGEASVAEAPVAEAPVAEAPAAKAAKSRAPVVKSKSAGKKPAAKGGARAKKPAPAKGRGPKKRG